jgi:hypothetical protein
VVRGGGGLILVDPGIDGSDLNQQGSNVRRAQSLPRTDEYPNEVRSQLRSGGDGHRSALHTAETGPRSRSARRRRRLTPGVVVFERISAEFGPGSIERLRRRSRPRQMRRPRAVE